jgi:hypothetical protein
MIEKLKTLFFANRVLILFLLGAFLLGTLVSRLAR